MQRSRSNWQGAPGPSLCRRQRYVLRGGMMPRDAAVCPARWVRWHCAGAVPARAAATCVDSQQWPGCLIAQAVEDNQMRMREARRLQQVPPSVGRLEWLLDVLNGAVTMPGGTAPVLHAGLQRVPWCIAISCPAPFPSAPSWYNNNQMHGAGRCSCPQPNTSTLNVAIA